jgi:hypothetical protein
VKKYILSYWKYLRRVLNAYSMTIRVSRLVFCFLIFSGNFVLAQNSILSQGRWFKIGITQTGIYRVDAAFLKQIRAESCRN